MSTYWGPAPTHQTGVPKSKSDLSSWFSPIYNRTSVCRPNNLPTPDKPGIKKGSSSLCKIKPDEQCCTGSKVHRGDGLMGSELLTVIFDYLFLTC